MKSTFEKSLLSEELPVILTLSHGPLAGAVIESMEFILGKQENIFAFMMEEGENPEQYIAAVLDVIEEAKHGAIVFLDIMGGTPFNMFCMNAKQVEDKIAAFAGMNLPMLISAATLREEMGVKEVAKNISEEMRTTVVDVMADVIANIQG